MKKLSIIMLALAIMLVSAQTATAKEIPWYDNTDGNPYTDTDGDAWAVHQIANSGTTYQDWSNYTAMTWNNSRWEGNAMLYGHPVYTSNKSLDSTGYSGNRRSALTFDPAVSGSYSWTGGLRYQDNNGSRISTILFGKFSSSDVWSELHSVDMTDNQILDLDNVTALQDISVGTGERLAVVICPNTGGAVAALYFNYGSDPVGIVPEPATMTLLGLGGIGLLIRRRRRA